MMVGGGWRGDRNGEGLEESMLWGKTQLVKYMNVFLGE